MSHKTVIGGVSVLNAAGARAKARALEPPNVGLPGFCARRTCRECGVTYVNVRENFTSQKSHLCKVCAAKRPPGASLRAHARTCVVCGEHKVGLEANFRTVNHCHVDICMECEDARRAG